MKFPLPAVIIVSSVFVAGCNSLDNPFAGMGLLNSGHDARVFNSQTGEYEWPKDSKKRPASRVTGLAGATPAPQPKSDGRYFDIQKNQWVEAPEERSTSSRPKPKPATPAPSPAAPGSASTSLLPAPAPLNTPQVARPEKASGVYNSATGEIEWRDYDPAPHSAPAPKKKSWYWPF